jgi:putative FmdB family regulatory protein
VPIYEYQCDACQHKFETIQKVSDPLLEECPECKEKSLRKLVSAAAFRLKGTGWYATDFKDKPAGKTQDQSKAGTDNKDTGSSSQKDTTSSSASSSETTSSKADRKTDKKPASKTD